MSIFGQPAQPKPNLFSGFGAQASASNTAGQPQQNPGLFGTPSNKPPATGGGLFGQQAKPSLFGNAGASQSTQQATTGGFFGNTNQPAQANAGTGTGLFGNTSTATAPTNTGTGLFGQPSQPAQQQPTSNIFGQPQAQAQQPQQGSLFGATQQHQPQQGALFGASTQQPQQQPQQPTLSLFGQPQPQQQQQPAPSLFGQQTNKPTLFGATSAAPAPQTQQQQAAPTASIFGAQAPLSASLLAQPKETPEQQLQRRIEEIANAWDSSSPQCKFQHYFYNSVDPSQVHLYGKPANANQLKWDQAVRENPDPSCLVPVLALGFDDVQKRAEAQQKSALQHQEKLKELRKSLEDLSQKHVLQNSLRLQRLAVLQTQLTHRLLHFTQHLHLLIPTVRSSSIRPEEEKLRTSLESIGEELRGKGGDAVNLRNTGRLRAHLNELWAVVGQLQALKQRERERNGESMEWQVADPEGLQKIASALVEEHHGLAYIINLLQDSARALQVIEEGTANAKGPPPSSPTKRGFQASSAGYRSASGLSSSFLLGRSQG